MNPVRAQSQKGATLLLGMLILAMFSLAVTSAWSDNQWQLRLGKNQNAEQRALMAASSALEWAEAWLMSLPGETRPVVCTQTCDPDAVILATGLGPESPEKMAESWWLDHAYQDGIEPHSRSVLATRQLPGSPVGRWLVEEVHYSAGEQATGTPAISYFRVLARAARAPQGTPVVLETIIARPWGAAGWRDDLPRRGTRFCHQADSPARCGRLAWQRRQ